MTLQVIEKISFVKLTSDGLDQYGGRSQVKQGYLLHYKSKSSKMAIMLIVCVYLVRESGGTELDREGSGPLLGQQVVGGGVLSAGGVKYYPIF